MKDAAPPEAALLAIDDDVCRSGSPELEPIDEELLALPDADVVARDEGPAGGPPDLFFEHGPVVLVDGGEELARPPTPEVEPAVDEIARPPMPVDRLELTMLEGGSLRYEDRSHDPGIKNYKRWGYLCPFHASCMKCRNVHIRQTSNYGVNEPLGYLGCWALMGRDLTKAEHQDKDCVPSLDGIEAYMRARGWYA